jgi:hypothetical protein
MLNSQLNFTSQDFSTERTRASIETLTPPICKHRTTTVPTPERRPKVEAPPYDKLCFDCAKMEKRVIDLEHELEMTNMRLEEFQGTVLRSLGRISEDVSTINKRVSPGLSVSRLSDEETRSSPKIGSGTSAKEAIADACITLEKLIIEARTRLHS